MNVLIRELRTGRLFGFFKEWTPTEDCALCFDSTIDALVFARDCGLKNVELVARFNDGNPEVHLPVDELLDEPEMAPLP